MFYSNPRNRRFSKSLSKLVHQNLGEEIERDARQRANGSTDQREVSILCENVRKRVDQFQMQDEHCRQERSAVLDSRKSEMLAANLLERLQSYATITFQKPLFNEQGNRMRHRDEAYFSSRD